MLCFLQEPRVRPEPIANLLLTMGRFGVNNKEDIVIFLVRRYVTRGDHNYT